ncbi:MAG: tyrosine--tRNA ligase [Christensenellaceae bacterium]|jgi:tyrosyl-tRNA synthetase|nr:tyrosine--tRNA ligase [Christensenellaceae bacterium]
MLKNNNIFEDLQKRGFIKQVVYEEDLKKLLSEESVVFYVGFDPTADSLHVGHMLALMGMSRLQAAGHKPIVLCGGGTGLIGDPSGRTDMRPMNDVETISYNIECFKKQMTAFFSFDGSNGAIILNNADWLANLNYIDFLREVGVHFSVNRMLAADCFKMRLEKGLSFMEFNYMLMQAYDFLVLHNQHGCKLQCGGDDQWSNILAGADLIRRKTANPAFVLTFPLLTTSDGIKMGKTRNGAVWLDPKKTSPYEFFQYFRNVDDADVANCLRFLTFVDSDEIDLMTMHADERMNVAKERLAYEATKIVHGEDNAKRALEQSKGAFGDGGVMPESIIPKSILTVVDALIALGLAKSKSEAKRLIEGGGIVIDDVKITSQDAKIPAECLKNGFVLYKGKKTRLRVSVE